MYIKSILPDKMKIKLIIIDTFDYQYNPLPPKYSLGYWWCRFWQYSDFEFVDLGKQIRSFGIPIDVMVLDMDWHETWSLRRSNPPKDEFGQRIGWTGYTWNATLFPNPANHLQDLHDLGLKTTLNLHPASGIQPYEEPYDRFVKDYLSRTSDYDGPKGYIKEDGTKAPVPFRIDQEAWADAYFNSVIRPFERQGVDFWWLDWQQWRLSKYTEGLSNTFWLNYTFFNDIVRQSAHEGAYARRPMIYHRWGGIGSHRYQIGFSGDTQASWKVLSCLPGGEGNRPRTLHALAPERRLHPDLQDPLDQGRHDGEALLGLPGPFRRDAAGHPAPLRPLPVHLRRGAADL